MVIHTAMHTVQSTLHTALVIVKSTLQTTHSTLHTAFASYIVSNELMWMKMMMIHTSVHIQLPKSAGLHCIKPTEQTWKKSCEQLVNNSHKAQSISTHTGRYLKLVLRLPETMSPWLKWWDKHQTSHRLGSKYIRLIGDECKNKFGDSMHWILFDILISSFSHQQFFKRTQSTHEDEKIAWVQWLL